MLFDAVRKLLELTPRICFSFGVEGWRQSGHNLKKIKKLYRKAQKLRHSTSGDEAKQAARQEVIKDAYAVYVDVVESFVLKSKGSVLQLRRQGCSDVAALLLIERYIGHAERQIDQIRRRVLNGEVIPHDEKVFSIFEEHTEWICKGKAGVRQELGLKVCVLEDQYGFLLHHRVMEKQTDEKIAVAMVTEAKNRFPGLNSCSFDKGFYSPANRRELVQILDKVVMPKKGRLSLKEKEIEYGEEFIHARHRHSAIESAINALENHGLDRCPDHGIRGFKSYVALAVIARNLQVLGNIIQQKKLKRLKKQHQALAA